MERGHGEIPGARKSAPRTSLFDFTKPRLGPQATSPVLVPPPRESTILFPLATRRPEIFIRSRPPRSGSGPQLPPPQPDIPESGQTRGSGRTPAAILPQVLCSKLRLEAIIQFRETMVPYSFFARERKPLFILSSSLAAKKKKHPEFG